MYFPINHFSEVGRLEAQSARDASMEIEVSGIHFVGIDQIISLLSLTGVVLNALGGLHLAYDLLGAKQGPLRLLARLFTYSALIGLGYGVLLGLWFGLAGAFFLGPAIEYQLWRRSRGIIPSTLEWVLLAAVRGLAFGVAGWLTVGRDFGIAFGILSAIVMHVTYEFGFGTNTYRIYNRPGLDRADVWAGFIRGGVVGLAGILSGAITGRSEALLDGIQIGLVVGALNTAVTILSPPVEWWADNLPDRALGGYGAFLVLIGSALQTVQYVTPLIRRR
jgi:hypothetical protein